MNLQEQIDKYCATKVNLVTFREDTEMQFGQLHVAIGRVEARLAQAERRIIRWFIGTAIALSGVVFALARYLH